MMLKASRKQFDELAQRFGPAIAAGIEGLGSAQIDADMEGSEMLGGVTDSVGGLLRGLVAGLDPNYHAKLADALAANTLWKNPDSGEFAKLTNDLREVMFGKNLLTEAKLIWWCLTVQYADFLGPLQTLGMQAVSLRSVTASALSSRKELTGLHTASPPAASTATA
jgi:hypothetical protein